MKTSRFALAASLATLMLAAPAPSALAYDGGAPYQGFKAGDILVRGRGLTVLPTVDSTVTPIGGHVDATQSFEPEGDITYFFTPNIAVEAIAAVTTHHLKALNTSLGDVDLGHVTLLPPTVSVQYHFMPEKCFKPYLGVGVNYTHFFDSNPKSGSAATKIDYEDNFGASIQAGADFHVQGNWFVNVDVKHIFLSTTAKINGGAIKGDVDLNPTIVGAGIGYKF